MSDSEIKRQIVVLFETQMKVLQIVLDHVDDNGTETMALLAGIVWGLVASFASIPDIHRPPTLHRLMSPLCDFLDEHIGMLKQHLPDESPIPYRRLM